MTGLTEEKHIAAVELVNKVSKAVDELVNELTKDADPVVDELARTLLSENYCFWR